MRFLAALGLFCFLTASLASAQVSVSARMDRERYSFLLYERVDLLVTVTNTGEADVVLDNEEGHPWLSFLMTKPNHLPVRAERTAHFKPLTLKVGETKTLKVNLTPLFSFREEGDYFVSAVINLPGAGDVMSDSVPFSVQRGRVVWSQQRPVAGGERTYALIRFSPKPTSTMLYLRVEDLSANTIYANVGLGDIEAFVDPQVFFDPQGNLHILHILAMSTYLYTRADQDGKILHQGVFKTFQQIPPRLSKMDDGSIFVAGGMEESAETVRDTLSAGQRGANAPDAVGVAVPSGNVGTPPPGPKDTVLGLPDATPTASTKGTTLH